MKELVEWGVGVPAYIGVGYCWGVYVAAREVPKANDKEGTQVVCFLGAVFWPVATIILLVINAIATAHALVMRGARKHAESLHSHKITKNRVEMMEHDNRRQGYSSDVAEVWDYESCPKCWGYGYNKGCDCSGKGVVRVKRR